MTDSGLRRQIGLWTATAVVVGEVVGVGIFLTPAGMTKSLGSPLLVLVVWLLSGLMALSGALCYGELAARFPKAGGGYVYLREAYGAPLAFLYGWMAFLVLDPGLTAALAVGAASYIGYAAGLSPAGVKALAVSSVLAVAAVNLRGVRLFVLRRRGAPAAYMTPLYPLTPALYVVLSAGLLALLAGSNPRQALAGVAVVALGLPVYYLLFRRRARREGVEGEAE